MRHPEMQTKGDGIYSKGYQIGYDSGLSDGRDNSKGANAASIDPSRLGLLRRKCG
jgi:hypothetical protein